MGKLLWGLIGGGESSQVGFAHRAAAQVDGEFNLVAGALDLDPDSAIEFGNMNFKIFFALALAKDSN